MGGGEEGEGRGGEGEGQDGMGERRRGEARNHRVPTTTDHSTDGVPPSRSPRLTVMGDLKRHSKLV